MKIGEVVNRINASLTEENDKLPAEVFINPTKINGFRKMDLIIPALSKKDKKSYYNFEEFHVQLLQLAYRKIVFQHMRTRDAFEQAREELKSLSLF